MISIFKKILGVLMLAVALIAVIFIIPDGLEIFLLGILAIFSALWVMSGIALLISSTEEEEK